MMLKSRRDKAKQDHTVGGCPSPVMGPSEGVMEKRTLDVTMSLHLKIFWLDEGKKCVTFREGLQNSTHRVCT